MTLSKDPKTLSHPFVRLLRRLYDARRAVLPPTGLRSKPAIALSIVLATALMSVILSLSWVQKSEADFLKNSSGVVFLDELTWQINPTDGAARTVSFAELADFPTPPQGDQRYTMTLDIPRDVVTTWAKSFVNESLVLALPEFDFEAVYVTATWSESREIMWGEKLMLAFSSDVIAAHQGPFTVTLKLLPQKAQKTLMRTNANVMPPFLSGMTRYNTFLDFAASRRVGSGKQLADIGRIVLALFTVLLFVFIDSSAECLALGIFMSLKALGVIAAQRWYPDGSIAPWIANILPGFLLSFADFMQLYFFTQLARLAKPRQFAWLGAGVVFGVVYAGGISIPPEFGNINWSREVWRYRNIFIGAGCMACSVPVAILCYRDKHYHRMTALIVASLGVLSQLISPLIVDYPSVSGALWFKTWYNLFETQTPYVFALSTFINVSTLEKRVKTLSDSAVQADIIERDMALGKTVQQAFLKVPPMPQGISVAYLHEPAMYVSGDILFSHYNESNKTVTAIMCDVTGHGVQAAIKASVCSAMCDYIWNDGRLRSGEESPDRLGIFFRRVTSLLSKISGEPELLAVVGCEISLEKRIATFYRANAASPLIVTRGTISKWNVHLESQPSGKSHTMPLGSETYVLLFSDGLLDSSRTIKAFVQWLTKRLENQDSLTADELKSIIAAYENWPKTGDDRTLCVLSVA